MNVESLPKLPPPPDNLPSFVRDEWISAQKVSDQQYVYGPGGFNNFADGAAAYLTTQQIKWANSPDRKAYVADPFPMTIPQRPILSFDELGAQLPTTFAPADPNLRMPVFVPPADTPAPTPTGGLGGGYKPPVDAETMGSKVIDEIKAFKAEMGAYLMGNFSKLNAKLDDLKK